MRLLIAATCLAVLRSVGPRCPALATLVLDPRTTFPDALAGVLSLVLVVVAAWAALVLVLTATGSRGRSLAQALTPRLLRGTLMAGVAAGMTVAPALADEPLDGLRLPDRATTAPPPATTSHHGTNRTDNVVVQAGDTLWSIARSHPRVRHHHPGLEQAALAREVRQWHRTNAATIGPDPDLIRPGQRLIVPEERS